MDVEGHELKILNGSLSSVFDVKVDFLQFEFGQVNISSRTYFKDLFELISPSYHVFQILDNGLYKVEYEILYEFFGVTNFVAINKDLIISKNKIIKYL